MNLFASILLLAALAMSSPAAQTKSTRAVGPVTANVRIDLFSDFQCPACKALHEQTIKRVKEDFAMKGKLRLVHHDFPLPQHKYARQAAILAAAADRLGKYDEVADALFRQQESWSQSGNVDAVVDGVLTQEERKKLREIAKDPAILANIERDIQLGQRMKVSSTPTMIVTHDGKPNPVVGVVSYTVFSKFLNTIVGP
ncbi:MAG: thioredoxin domain-containing protein [Vicinamibacterales bacterium]